MKQNYAFEKIFIFAISRVLKKIFIPDRAVVAFTVAAIAVSAVTFVGATIVVVSEYEQV